MARKRSHNTHKSIRKSRKSSRRKSRGHAAKKTHPARRLSSKSMSLTELQNMAKSRGVPFGGLTKSQLQVKIRDYY